jgi:hypothetical protein
MLRIVSKHSGALSKECKEAKYITSDRKGSLGKIFWRKEDEMNGQFMILRDKGIVIDVL